MYKGGFDPVQQEVKAVTSSSINSFYIYKTVYNPAHQLCDIIVACYNGRKLTSEADFEEVRKLAHYYGLQSELLYENMSTRFKTFLEYKRGLHMLSPTPHTLSNIIKDSVVDRLYGVHANTQIRRHFESLIRDWLLAEFSPGRFNVERIYDVNLLRELLAYDGEVNCDRVDALGFALMKREADFNIPARTSIEDEVDFFASMDADLGYIEVDPQEKFTPVYNEDDPNFDDVIEESWLP